MTTAIIIAVVLLIAAGVGLRWSQDRNVKYYSFKVGPLEPGKTMYPIGIYDNVGTKLKLSLTSIDGASQSFPIMTIESSPISKILYIGSIPVHLTIADYPRPQI